MKRLILFFMMILLAAGISFEPADFKAARQDMMTVSILGAVDQEGEYEVPLYSTVDDVLKLAGTNETTDLTALNPQSVLKDHDLIIVPETRSKEESPKISINTADAEELCQLKGIGPSTAQKIIDYREENGLFQTLEDLMRVKGIGQSTFEKIMNDICL